MLNTEHYYFRGEKMQKKATQRSDSDNLHMKASLNV